MSIFNEKENTAILAPQQNGFRHDSVTVSIEPNHESEIFELKYDGQEVYKEPLNYSDSLAQLISKIDFNNIDEKISSNPEAQRSHEKEQVLAARKFYQNVQEKVKLSLDEVSVLLDCLTIAKADKLIGIETRDHLNAYGGIGGGEESADVSDRTLSVLLKKKNIEKVKGILKKSLEKISSDIELSNIKFHLELYRARQIWRIKKVGTKFNCDLSYRTVGCINALKANMELVKNDSLFQPSQQQEHQQNNRQQSQRNYLSVIIPEEFKDYAYIKAEIVKNSRQDKKSSIVEAKFSLFTHNAVNQAQNWQEILEREQNSIYCKEIYNQLLRETFDPNSTLQLRPVITGNSIKIMINMEYDLLISLVHTKDKNIANQTFPKDYNFDNAILEYYLHCLLKKSFDQNFFHYDQRPITSMFAYNIQVKIAGMAYSNLNLDNDDDSVISLPHQINHLINKKKKINLLQSIKEKAEHLLVRRKVLKILSGVSRRVGEPHITIEQSAWNSASATDIIVIISSSYFENVAKSFFHITIKQSQITVLNRSSNFSISFTDSVSDLKGYFLDQCCFHQINLILTVSQIYGWKVLGNSFVNEMGNKLMSGIALIYNDKFSKKIGIRIGPVNDLQLFVNQYAFAEQTADSDTGADLRSLIGDLNVNWLTLKDKFKPVDVNAYPGFTKIQKFELFLANYSTAECL